MWEIFDYRDGKPFAYARTETGARLKRWMYFNILGRRGTDYAREGEGW